MIKYNLCFLNVTSRFASNLDQNITEADFDGESDGILSDEKDLNEERLSDEESNEELCKEDRLKNELADLNEQLRQERMNH